MSYTRSLPSTTPPSSRRIIAAVPTRWMIAKKLSRIQACQDASAPPSPSSGTAAVPGVISSVKIPSKDGSFSTLRARREAAVWTARSKSTSNQLAVTFGFVKISDDVIVTFPRLKKAWPMARMLMLLWSRQMMETVDRFQKRRDSLWIRSVEH